MITEHERTQIRRQLGQAVLAIQSQFLETRTPQDVVPEIIAALLSLAAFVCNSSGGLSETEFNIACEMAAREQWPKIGPFIG